MPRYLFWLTLGAFAIGTEASWRREIDEWVRRSHERGCLAQMSDRELRDIGLTRAEAHAEIRKPFWRE
jgi:uncharacterized protein YjiS (DUF1127 family)